MAPALRISVASVCLLCLASCVSAQAERANMATSAQANLVGLPEAELLACAGVPERQAEQGLKRFYTYERHTLASSVVTPSTSFGVGLGSGRISGAGFGVGFGAPLSGSGVRTAGSASCQATFTIEQGRVSRLEYATSPGDSSAAQSQCYDIVSTCL